MSTFESPTRLSPFYGIAQGLGARFAGVGDWQAPEVYSTVEAEVASAKGGVALADETPNGRVVVEGSAAEGVVRAAFGAGDLAVGAGVEAGAGRVYRLRVDRFFVSTQPGGEAAAQKALADASQGASVTVTDLTHGWAEVRAVGPAGPDLMSRVCGLDFSPQAFPNGAVRQSSVAKTAQVVIRRDAGDLPAFSIIGARSLADYLWDVLMEAGGEWEIAPIGRAAMQALEEDRADAV